MHTYLLKSMFRLKGPVKPLRYFQSAGSKDLGKITTRYYNTMATGEEVPSGLSAEEIASCLHEPDATTKDFIMQQTMMRVKDPKKSLEFYSKVLGMRLLHDCHFPAMKFSLYFMGYAKAEDIPSD